MQLGFYDTKILWQEIFGSKIDIQIEYLSELYLNFVTVFIT